MERELVEKQRVFFRRGETRSLVFRKAQLQKLLQGLSEEEDILLKALEADLGKHPFEGYATELGVVRGEIRAALRKLKSWSRTRKTVGPLTQFPSSGRLMAEPKGCVLILAPWNYPVQLILAPLVSEDAPETSGALARMIKKLYPEEYIASAPASVEGNGRFLSLPFDHIFFTGSPQVGRIVMGAAAKNLTPVTLELGGKSPCIVDLCRTGLCAGGKKRPGSICKRTEKAGGCPFSGRDALQWGLSPSGEPEAL